MKAKEKARELVLRFKKYSSHRGNDGFFMNQESGKDNAKQCALICVDNIIETLKPYWKNWDEGHAQYEFEYWQEVKQKIKDLKK